MKQIYLNDKDTRTLEKILDYRDGYSEYSHFTISKVHLDAEAYDSILYCIIVGYGNMYRIKTSELPFWLRLKVKIKGMDI
jgi:hypothetical protein